jgi:cell shape-determining protein MreD
MIKYLYYFIISLVLVLLVQSFFPNLGIFSNINVLLIFLIFVLIVWGFNAAFVYALFIGLFLNIYSYMPLGSFIVIYLIILLGANFLYKNVFINFSLFTSLILIILSTLLFQILFITINFISYLLGLVNIYTPLDKIFLSNLIWQLVINSILIALIFIFGQVTTKKLNLAFLIKR